MSGGWEYRHGRTHPLPAQTSGSHYRYYKCNEFGKHYHPCVPNPYQFGPLSWRSGKSRDLSRQAGPSLVQQNETLAPPVVACRHRGCCEEEGETSSSDGKSSISPSTHCSSSLSVDVSAEMAAVTRALDALVSRHERRQQVLLDGGRRHHHRESRCHPSVAATTASSYRQQRQTHQQQQRLLTSEQMKLLAMERPPLDRLQELPLDYLKPRPPPPRSSARVKRWSSRGGRGRLCDEEVSSGIFLQQPTKPLLEPADTSAEFLEGMREDLQSCGFLKKKENDKNLQKINANMEFDPTSEIKIDLNGLRAMKTPRQQPSPFTIPPKQSNTVATQTLFEKTTETNKKTPLTKVSEEGKGDADRPEITIINKTQNNSSKINNGLCYPNDDKITTVPSEYRDMRVFTAQTSIKALNTLSRLKNFEDWLADKDNKYHDIVNVSYENDDQNLMVRESTEINEIKPLKSVDDLKKRSNVDDDIILRPYETEPELGVKVENVLRLRVTEPNTDRSADNAARESWIPTFSTDQMKSHGENSHLAHELKTVSIVSEEKISTVKETTDSPLNQENESNSILARLSSSEEKMGGLAGALEEAEPMKAALSYQFHNDTTNQNEVSETKERFAREENTEATIDDERGEVGLTVGLSEGLAGRLKRLRTSLLQQIRDQVSHIQDLDRCLEGVQSAYSLSSSPTGPS